MKIKCLKCYDIVEKENSELGYCLPCIMEVRSFMQRFADAIGWTDYKEQEAIVKQEL